MEQRTDEWHAARLGKVTASRIADVTARTKSGWGAGRKNYMAELVVERLTGEPAPFYMNSAMQWGIDKEPEAADAYAFEKGYELEEVGFIDHPTIPMTGASPDRRVLPAGLVEFKCPQTATHIDFLQTEKIPDKYVKQMMWQMACTGDPWCDFGSFDPRMPIGMQLLVVRVERDDRQIAALERDVKEFLAELNVMVEDLRSKFA